MVTELYFYVIKVKHEEMQNNLESDNRVIAFA